MKIQMKAGMKAWMLENWGKRCPDYAARCPLCRAWKSFDCLFEHYENGFKTRAGHQKTRKTKSGQQRVKRETR